ncbi:MAG TPA: lysophospholipid acyltransferase family protein [Chthonomonadales bacterium]|nr:lysophospholipid acyltransferase family protein [Chthonomonadales bacterium]
MPAQENRDAGSDVTQSAARPVAVPGATPQSRRAWALGLAAWFVSRLIGLTLRVRWEGRERLEEAVAADRGAILVTWHGRTLIPANVFRRRGFWALISLSRDGEIQDNVLRRYGFRTVRGSTGRGGARAALQLARRIRAGGVLAFTPDGPRGPTRRVQAGTIFLAHRCRCPVIPIGVSAWPCWRARSWDRYLVPLPFARGAVVIGEPIAVPEAMDEAAERRVTEELERAIDAAEARADALVGLLAG